MAPHQEDTGPQAFPGVIRLLFLPDPILGISSELLSGSRRTEQGPSP